MEALSRLRRNSKGEEKKKEKEEYPKYNNKLKLKLWTATEKKTTATIVDIVNKNCK